MPQLTSDQVAARLATRWDRRITAKTWRAYVRQGTAPVAVQRIGTSYLWDQADVDRWGAGLWRRDTPGPGDPYRIALREIGPELQALADASRTGTREEMDHASHGASRLLVAVGEAFHLLSAHARETADRIAAEMDQVPDEDVSEAVLRRDELRRVMYDLEAALDAAAIETIHRRGGIGPDVED